MDLMTIEKNKNEFIELLRSTNRDGIENLISWLTEKSDFFNAPSSTIYHGNFAGGLCLHSLNVYYAAKKFYETYKELSLPEKNIDDIKEDNLIIASLLHDLCKANYYKAYEKFQKDESNNWIKYFSYKIDDKFPIGHGEKSVFIANTFIKLTGPEMLAIRWHMGTADPGLWMSNYTKPAMCTSFNKVPLSILIAQADFFASYCMEVEIDQAKDNRII